MMVSFILMIDEFAIFLHLTKVIVIEGNIGIFIVQVTVLYSIIVASQAPQHLVHWCWQEIKL